MATTGLGALSLLLDVCICIRSMCEPYITSAAYFAVQIIANLEILKYFEESTFDIPSFDLFSFTDQSDPESDIDSS